MSNLNFNRRVALRLLGGTFLAGSLALLSLGAQGAKGAPLKGVKPASATGSLPNFDLQGASRNTALAGVPATNRIAARMELPEQVTVRYSGLTGTVSRLYRLDGKKLSAPRPGNPDLVARQFLASNAGWFGQEKSDIANLVTSRSYKSDLMRAHHLTYSQRFRGIPVFRSDLKVNLTDRNEVLVTNGSLIPNLARTIASTRPKLSPAQGLVAAMKNAGLNGPAPEVLERGEGPRNEVRFAAQNGLTVPPVVKLSYYQIAPASTVLAWDTTVYQARTPDVYHVLVSADSGNLLYRQNYTASAHGAIYDQDAPQDGTPFTIAQPAVLNRVDETFDGGRSFNGTPLFNAGDPHFDWWNGAPRNITQTNSTRAGEARDEDDFSFFQPTPLNANSGDDFTFPIDLGNDASTYTNASVANLFYWNNRLHDIWYRFGFDEAAGNFQTANFSAGGVANDEVQALAQYGANQGFFNNANMSTPPDGSPPTMRMYEFTVTDPTRDSDIENGIITHEYGHGVTNRIVGNADGLNAFQSGAMGEGWSDFQALMVLTRPIDDRELTYPMGGWVLNDFAAGIRSQPYCANRTSASFHRTYYNIGDPGDPGQVHNGGEIICNTLWGCYVRMADRLGAQDARERVMRLFIDALKLAPNDPSFIDYRDMFLLADQNAFAGEDVSDIWAAFAAHGMGLGASTVGSSSSVVTESFAVPRHRISGRVSDSNGDPISGVAIQAVGPGETIVSATESPAAAIPDPGSLSRTLNINASGPITSVQIPINITHAFRGDLRISLSHGGRTVFLANVAPFGTDDRDNVVRTFGTVLFNGLEATGAWTLTIEDISGGDGGTLGAWSLDVGVGTSLTTATSTDTLGRYELTNLRNGNYVVRPISTSLTFNPTSRQVAIGPDKSEVNFVSVTAPPPPTKFELGGKVTLGADPFTGQQVVATGNIPSTLQAQTSPNVVIPDNTPAGIASAVSVQGKGTVKSVLVTVDITHTNVSDLEISLSHSDGTSCLLYSRSSDQANLNTTFPTLTPSEESMALFNGKASQGSWTLKVRDLAPFDSGRLRSWTLLLKYDQAFTRSRTTDSTGRYLFTDLNAGTYTVETVNSSYVFNPARIIATLGPDVHDAHFKAYKKPIAPSSLTAQAIDSNTVDLAWIHNSSPLTGFVLERKINNGTFGFVANLGPSVRTFRHANLPTNNTFTYRIMAANELATSGYRVAAPVNLLRAPGNLTATAATGRITLRWADNVIGELKYVVERSSGGGAFVAIGTKFEGATGYGDTTVTPGVTYTYRIRATATNSVSSYSNTAVATAVP